MTDHFEESVKLQKAAHNVQVLEDQFNDMSGVNVGRMTRTIKRGEDLDASGRKRDNKFDLVDLIMSMEEYAAYHAKLTSAVSDTRNKADNLAEKINKAIDAAENRIQGGLDNAITFPDGSKAFLDTETGIAWADDGTQLDNDLTAGIDWSGKTTRQEHQAALDALSKLHEYQIQTDLIIHGLADEQNTLDDTKEGGLSRDDMDAMQGRSDAKDQELDIISNGVDEMIKVSVAPTDFKANVATPTSLESFDF